MALDIFFPNDICNALVAADKASSSTARVCAAVGGDQATSRAYLEGYRAALATVALAFGLSPAIVGGGTGGVPDALPLDSEFRVLKGEEVRR